jgi:predicted alpha/beta-fold hydrolase
MRAITKLALAVSAAAAAVWVARARRADVREPQLDFHPSRFNEQVLARLDQLHRPYAPTPWLFNAHLQVLWLLLREAVEPKLRYERTDTLRMRDGGTTALDWIGLDNPPASPTLVVLPSITGDAQSMRSMVRDLRRDTGWRVVVCTRRGHGDLELTSPILKTMGCTEDLREQLARIREQFPDSPLYAVGMSAGSAVLVRYLGEEGARSLIRAGVAYCPGYDIGVAWQRVPPLYNRLMSWRLKQYFLARHAPALKHLGTYDACLAARDLAAFHEQLYEMAGCANLDDYLARSNPMQVMANIAVPVMIINAADDPVCVDANARDHLETVRRVPDALLVRTVRGSHCAFHEGWTARSWANRLMANYLMAAADLGQARKADTAEWAPPFALPTWISSLQPV